MDAEEGAAEAGGGSGGERGDRDETVAAAAVVGPGRYRPPRPVGPPGLITRRGAGSLALADRSAGRSNSSAGGCKEVPLTSGPGVL